MGMSERSGKILLGLSHWETVCCFGWTNYLLSDVWQNLQIIFGKLPNMRDDDDDL